MTLKFVCAYGISTNFIKQWLVSKQNCQTLSIFQSLRNFVHTTMDLPINMESRIRRARPVSQIQPTCRLTIAIETFLLLHTFFLFLQVLPQMLNFFVKHNFSSVFALVTHLSVTSRQNINKYENSSAKLFSWRSASK